MADMSTAKPLGAPGVAGTAAPAVVTTDNALEIDPAN
jgi:hypothetical protein